MRSYNDMSLSRKQLAIHLALSFFLLFGALSTALPAAHAQVGGLAPGAPYQSSGSGSYNSSTGCSNGNSTQLCNPLQATSLLALVTDVLQLVVYIGSIVVVFMIIVTGFLFVAARGNPGEIEKARNALLWTVIGGLIILGSEALAQGIYATAQAIGAGA